MSFFVSFEHAMAWRKKRIGRDATCLVIIAVWLSDKEGVYDAYELARNLGYTNSRDDKRRRLVHHKGELLVDGGVDAREDRILALLRGDSVVDRKVSLRPVLSMKNLERLIARVPEKCSIRDEEDLRKNAGHKSDLKFCILVLSLCGYDYTMERADS